MPTKPIDEVIPRDGNSSEVAKILGRFADAIEETVNFGSHVLKWHLEFARGGDENMPITLSFRHILELLDSISINIRHSSVDPCKLLLRGALESFFGLAYILEADTERRGMAFMATYVNQRLKTYNNLDPSTDQGKEFCKMLKKDRIAANMVISIPPALIKSLITNLETWREKPKYKEANAEYQRLKKTGVKTPYWYSLYGGPKNIEQLANHLHLPAMYHILYRQWSSSTHGTDIIYGKISPSPTAPGILQLRLPTEAQAITHLAISIGLQLFPIFIKHYAPKRMHDYNLWYTRELRSLYLRLSQDDIIRVKL